MPARPSVKLAQSPPGGHARRAAATTHTTDGIEAGRFHAVFNVLNPLSPDVVKTSLHVTPRHVTLHPP